MQFCPNPKTRLFRLPSPGVSVASAARHRALNLILSLRPPSPAELLQGYADAPFTSASLGKMALMRSICQFLWCEDPHLGRSPVTTVTSLIGKR